MAEDEGCSVLLGKMGEFLEKFGGVMSGGFGAGLGALFGGVLFDSMETGHVGGGSASDAEADAEEPACERVGVPDGGGAAAEDEEDGLKGIFGRVGVEMLTAEAQDHWAVALDEGREGGFGDGGISAVDEDAEELAIGQARGGAEMVEGGEAGALFERGVREPSVQSLGECGDRYGSSAFENWSALQESGRAMLFSDLDFVARRFLIDEAGE